MRRFIKTFLIMSLLILSNPLTYFSLTIYYSISLLILSVHESSSSFHEALLLLFLTDDFALLFIALYVGRPAWFSKNPFLREFTLLNFCKYSFHFFLRFICNNSRSCYIISELCRIGNRMSHVR